jgi:acyl-coenzyme A thioesterase PaaI-like protein
VEPATAQEVRAPCEAGQLHAAQNERSTPIFGAMPPSNAAPGQRILTLWNRLSPLPGGRTAFSIILGRMAPYTGTIGARCRELRPGYSRWELRDRRKVRNHLSSVHAVALVNLAEVTSGTAMLVSLPPTVRGIVTGLGIEYLKKARGVLVAECRCEIGTVSGKREEAIPATVRDADGDVVARAEVRWLLSPVPG